MDKKRTLLMEEIWESQNEAWALMNEYDSLPHQYGDFVLHQALSLIHISEPTRRS